MEKNVRKKGMWWDKNNKSSCLSSSGIFHSTENPSFPPLAPCLGLLQLLPHPSLSLVSSSLHWATNLLSLSYKWFRLKWKKEGSATRVAVRIHCWSEQRRWRCSSDFLLNSLPGLLFTDCVSSQQLTNNMSSSSASFHSKRLPCKWLLVVYLLVQVSFWP